MSQMKLLLLSFSVLFAGVLCQGFWSHPGASSFPSNGTIHWSPWWSAVFKALDLTRFMEGVSKALSAPLSFLEWLVANEEYTEFDKSDLHDTELSHTLTQLESSSLYDDSNSAQRFEPTSWTSHVSDIAKAGREITSFSNLMALGYESVLQTVTCLATTAYSDPDLGTFGLNASKYCDANTGRLIPGVLCCAPMTPKLLDVKLRLKIKGQPERLLNFRNATDKEFLTAPGRVVFIIHGWIEKMSALKWITDMRDGFTDLDENVIIVDWRRGNAVHYWQSIANTRVVAAIVGRAILNWGIADRTLLVGFSLGGQIVGEAGQFTQKNGGVLINECHGLDPAGPFYDGGSDDITLDKTDCRLVQALHTSAEDIRTLSLFAVRFGTYKKSGHCDYWVNCGFNQGPCIDMDFRDLVKASTRMAMMSDGEMVNYVATRACSHWRAPEVYVSALRKRCEKIGNPFVSYPCPKCGKGHYCMDTGHLPASNNTIPPFSQCSPDRDDNYYVSSGTYEPFCTIEGNKK